MKLITKDQYAFPFVLDQLYTLQINSEYAELPHETVVKIIKSVLLTVALQSPVMIQFKIASFLQDIEWQWMTNRGALHKRIGKWLKDKHYFTMPDELSCAIGNLVRENIVKDQTYYFDFTKTFNWEHGDYGDYDSCFFKRTLGSRNVVPKYFADDPRVYAIRFYKPKARYGESKLRYTKGDTGYAGIARAWFAVENIKKGNKTEEEQVYFIFNGYGLTTNQIGSIFGTYLGLATNRIGMLNSGTFDGTTYVNEAAIAVGPSSIVGELRNYDLGLDGNKAHRSPKIDDEGRFDEQQLTCDVLPGLWSMKQEKRRIVSYLQELAKRSTQPKTTIKKRTALEELIAAQAEAMFGMPPEPDYRQFRIDIPEEYR